MIRSIIPGLLLGMFCLSVGCGDGGAADLVRKRRSNLEKLGAAYLAAVGAGLYDSLHEAVAHWQCQRRFEPELDPGAVQHKLERWRWAVERVKTT